MQFGNDFVPSTVKPDIIIGYNKIKSGVGVVDKMCATVLEVRFDGPWQFLIVT